MPQIPIKNWFVSKYEKLVVSVIIAAILTTQVFGVGVVAAFDLIPDFIDGGAGDQINELVAIVVEKELGADNSKYPGLTGAYEEYLGFTSTTIESRIARYAEDVKEEHPGTDVKILIYDKETDSVPDLANALENLYINGDDSENRLSGVVLVGNIPLPVVNKEGNRFVSMYPYTDFFNKAYIYNPKTLAFERNEAVTFPQPEIWHGVIKGSKSELAEYFDKNHLYYEGVNEYAKFDKRMFFGDLVHEEEMTNSDLYEVYVKYIESMEDLAYMRYNKYWANELMGSMLEDTFGDEGLPINENFSGTPVPDEYAGLAGVKEFDPNEFKNLVDGSGANLMANMPDIHAKNVIDKYAAPYYTIFPKFLARVNDFADQTGRYESSEMDSMPELISTKDEYTKTYLRLVNDAVEKEINSVIETIEQPMPLISESKLTGEFDNGPSGKSIPFSLDLLLPGSDQAVISYNFSPDGKTYYINGRETDFIDNPKQCSVFMGSTKTNYFDENLDYNPMREEVKNPEYSVMTRAIRTDDSLTAQPLRTFGLNTRMLSPNEAIKETDGLSSNGAIMEDDPELGVPSYINTTYSDTGVNPLIEKIGYKDGDTFVITKINNIAIDYNYTVSQAAKNAYDVVKKIIETYNNDQLANQNAILNYFDQYTVYEPNFVVGAGEVKRAVAGLKIEYVLNGKQQIKYLTFTVHDDDEKYKTSNQSAASIGNGPKLFVNLSKESVSTGTDAFGIKQINVKNFGNVFEGNSNGVIFTMYDSKNTGRDVSKYCYASSSGQYSDRCLYYIAEYPLYDPAGSIALSKGKEPNDTEYKLMFRENVNRTQEAGSSVAVNSSNQSDYDNLTYIKQYPEEYSFEQIDEVIWNSCYEGYQTTAENPLYINLIGALEGFKNNDSKVKGGAIWQNKDGVSGARANNVTLDNISSDFDDITLQTFANMYGLWDGIDNDNDGITDFEWRDTNQDGVYDQRFYDYKEANPKYGISVDKFQEISRKMLSHNTTYKIPAGELSGNINYGLTLNVETTPIKEISSMVIHNEPTEKTIYEQMKNMTTMDLPIDDPRYVVFQAQSRSLPKYPKPDPVDNIDDEDVQKIINGLDFYEYYVPGQMVRIDYPNIYDTDNVSQYKSELASVAAKLAVLPGAYEVFGPGADKEDYEPLDIFNEIYQNHLLPVIDSDVDDPLNGFDLDKAAESKIVDSLKWLEMNIDEKHQYVLDKYLDDGKNAFVGDKTNFPAGFGETAGFGYEAAYLVLDGEDGEFDMSFNKDLPEEMDANFNPVVAMEQYANSDGPEGVVLSDEAPKKGDGDDSEDEFEFVDLSQFLNELEDFITYFSTTPNLQEACSVAAQAKEELENLEDGVESSDTSVATGLPLAGLSLKADKTLVTANGSDVIKLTVSGVDANGANVGSWVNEETVTLNIDQNSADPVFNLNDTPEKILIGGKAEYNLVVTNNNGNVVVSAQTDSGISSGSVTLLATNSKIELNSYTYFEPEGTEELLNEIKIQKSAKEGGKNENSRGVDEGDKSEVNKDKNSEENSGEKVIGGNTGEKIAPDSSVSTSGVNEESASSLDKGENASVSTDGGVNSDNGNENSENGAQEVWGVQKDIQKVFSDIDNGGGGADGVDNDENENDIDEGEIGERGDIYGGAEIRDENGNIVILKSKPVEDEGEENGSSSGNVESDGQTVNDPVESVGTEEPVEWEQYYLDVNYYMQFLDGFDPGMIDVDAVFDVGSNYGTDVVARSKWIAEVYSDRMVAYIPNKENPFIDAYKNEESPYLIMSDDEFLADGESLMMVTASVFDGGGNLEQNNSHEVKFSIVESDYPNMVTFENGDMAVTENGVAAVYLHSGTKAGRFVIRAEVTDGLYPVQTKELYVMPGEPTSIEIVPESDLLVANNQSKTSVTVKLRDKYGNLANNALATVALFTDSGVGIDPKADTNGQILGTQISTIDGTAKFDLLAKGKVGDAKLIALLLDYDLEQKFLEVGNNWEKIDFSNYIGNSKTFKVADSVELDLIPDKKSLKVNGSDVLKIRAELKSGGKLVSGYNGPIKYTLLSPELGSFMTSPPEKMIDGVLHQENVKFRASTVSGEEEILVEIPGFVSDVFKFDVLPGDPKYVELTASNDTLTTDPLDEVVLQARLLDQYGNLVDTANNKIIQFSATDATSDLIQFKEAANSVVSNGIASNRISAKDVSGKVNVMATGDGLSSDTLSLDIKKHVTGLAAKNFNPRVLYMSVLGGAFGNDVGSGGDAGDEKNLAQEFLFGDGQVQAVSAVTAGTEEDKRLLSVDAYGKIETLSDTVISKIVQATDSFPYQKFVFSDSVSGVPLATAFVIPKGNVPVKLMDVSDDDGGEGGGSDGDQSGVGIYVRKAADADESLKFVLDEGEEGDVHIKKNGETKVKIDKFGRISISDKHFELSLLEEAANYGFLVLEDGNAVAEIEFRLGGSADVKVLNYDTAISSFVPGVYLQMDTNDKRYDISRAPSRYASDEARGVFLNDSDNKIDPTQAPRFAFSSLESASNEFGLGYEGDNKHMLLFASGNSVGESNMPYASDAGIIYGDPMVRLKVEGIVGMVSKLTNYSKVIGKQLLASDKPIKEMIPFEYNNDGREDILIIYEDGLVRLLENENSNKKFRDRGFVMDIYGGILSATRIDINDDGYDDLIVGTQDSCRKGEECVTLIENNKGNLVRSTLNLDIEGKIYDMKGDDVNDDGCEDLVVSDSASNLRIFYNQKEGFGCKGLEKNHGGKNQNFGFKIDSESNIRNTLFIYYSGIKAMYEGDPMQNFEDADASDYVTFKLDSSAPPQNSSAYDEEYISYAQDFQNSVLNNPNIAELSSVPQTYKKSFDFRHLPKDPRFNPGSTKYAIDENGGNLAVGDTVTYVVTLENSLSGTVDVMISDLMPQNMTLIEESLKCLNGCNEDPYFEDTGMSLRPKVIHTTVPGGGKRVISYSMTVDQLPEMTFQLGNDLADYPVKDEFTDIFVKPAGGGDGSLIYLYSKGLDANGYVIYSDPPYIKNPEITEDASSKAFDDAFGDMIPGKNNLLEGMQYGDPEIINQLGGSGAQDSDSNGCVDSWGSFDEAYVGISDAIAGGIEDVTSKLRCSGTGCSPIPYNKALFAPSKTDPGMSVFSAWPPTKFVGFGENMYAAAPSYFRLYMSPTLSLGLGTAVCAGPGGGASPCFAFAVPVGGFGLCDALEEGMDKAMSAASDVVTDANAGVTSVVSTGEEVTSSDAINESFNTSDPKSKFAMSGSVNVKVPGFPSVITNWLDNQTDEIYNKLLDLPDFYFIYPDMGGLYDQFAQSFDKLGKDEDGKLKIQSLNDFTTAVNSIPLVQIEGKEVLVKIPAISQNEWVKWKREAEHWLKHHENELNRLVDYVCVDQKLAGTDYVIDETQQRICDKFVSDMTELIQSVRSLMEKLDAIANLPRDVLNWRYLEAKYATQIVCYLDALVNYTGGYLKKQQKTIKSWMQAVEDAIRVFRDWKVVLDLMVDYQTSCDKCKNDHFSELGLLVQLFAAIPDPPIIPMPKWPDIVFDISQIETGVKIIWPDLVFRPEPIVLPDLPYVTFPDVIPNVAVDVPGFEVPEWILDFPTLALPNLPDLPPLPMPDLPDLPRPPKIPALPKVVAQLVADIKPILKIICLLKNGYLTVPENQLATQIETLTQPNVSGVMPILAKMGIQMPGIEYSYVEKIRIDAKLNMGISTKSLYNVVKLGANVMNRKVEWIIDRLNNVIDIPLQEYVNAAIDYAEQKAQEGVATAIDETLDLTEKTGLETSSGAGGESGSASVGSGEQGANEASLLLSNKLKVEDNMSEINSVIENYIAEIEKQNESYPETFYLVADQSYLNPEDLVLSKSIDEIENGILEQDLPDDPSLNRLVALRDSLIDYTKNLDDSNDLLENIDDFDEFTHVLVDSDESLRSLASLNVPVEKNDDVNEISGGFLGEAGEEALLIAANVQGAQSSVEAATQANNSGASVPKGWFVGAYQNGEMQNESIMGYTKELKNMQHFFNDVDNDGDSDIVYSMNGDVYLKENYEFNEELDEGKSVSKSYVSDYVVKDGSSLQNLEVPYSGSKTVELSWSKPNYPVYGYEVIIRKSIYDDPDDYVYRYEVNELENEDYPGLSINIENGSYYVTVFALDEDGERSLPSESKIIAPQVCADQDAPFPVVSNSALDVSIYKTLEINAEASFDPTGEITEYYIETVPNLSKNVTTLPNPLWSDLNTFVDENGDGKLDNDKSNPIFNVGPFEKSEDVGMHKMKLHVLDETKNEATQDVAVNVFAPEIELDKTFGRTSVASGSIDPALSKIPFVLLRNRYIYRVIDGKLSLVPRVDKVETEGIETEGKYKGKYLTNDLGEYEISGFETDDMILVENASGETVAEIDPETGNLGSLKSGYSYVVYPALPPDVSTHIDVVDADKNVVGTVYVVADANIDVTTYESMSFGSDNIEGLSGVHVSDINNSDKLILKSYGANNPTYPGGASLTLNDSPLVIFDTAGNIILTEDGRGSVNGGVMRGANGANDGVVRKASDANDGEVSLELKKNNHNTDPLVIDVYYKGEVAAEVYVGPSVNNVQIVGPDDVPYATPRPPDAAAYYGSVNSGKLFKDTDAELNSILEDLYAKGVIEGEQTENGINFNPDDLVQRAEFVKILLNMLCIVPRESAYLPYEPNEANGGFTDIKFSDQLVWYYPFVKEAALRGLINGYLGEVSSDTGLTPFKPEGTITRAEATKIILEALEMQGVIDMGEIALANPWYANYVEIGQNLSPYMVPGKLIKNNFIITEEEASQPNKPMTRAELIIMANRVLEMFNCFEIDDDNNGLSNFCEEKYQITDPFGDPDNDELTNINECYYGTDPFDKDTDGGGVFDGPEIEIGSNPLFDPDDKNVPKFPELKVDFEIQEGESGIFAVPADCNTCPCTSTFVHRADIIPGDIFFTTIMTLDEEYIFSKSNEVVIETVPK